MKKPKKIKLEEDMYPVLIKAFPGSVKLTSSGPYKSRGISDLCLNITGLGVWTECKINGEPLTELQKLFIARWEYAIVVDCNIITQEWSGDVYTLGKYHGDSFIIGHKLEDLGYDFLWEPK